MTRHLMHCSQYKAHLRREAGYDGNATSHQGMEMIDDLMGWSSACDSQVMSHDRLKEKVLRIIISGNLSFSFAENPEFVDLLNDAFPDCPAPTRKTVVDYLRSKATLTKAELAELLAKPDSHVSLALDIWVTRTGLAFLGVTSPEASFVGDFHCNVKVNPEVADPLFHVTMLIRVGVTLHFIDDKFRLQQELLGFVPLSGSHTAEYMAEVVYDLLEEYGIKKKFFCITTDNASNNITMVKELSRILSNNGISWDYKTRHIPWPTSSTWSFKRSSRLSSKTFRMVQTTFHLMISLQRISKQWKAAWRTEKALIQPHSESSSERFTLLQSPFVEVLTGGKSFSKPANRTRWSL